MNYWGKRTKNSSWGSKHRHLNPIARMKLEVKLKTERMIEKCKEKRLYEHASMVSGSMLHTTGTGTSGPHYITLASGVGTAPAPTKQISVYEFGKKELTYVEVPADGKTYRFITEVPDYDIEPPEFDMVQQ